MYTRTIYLRPLVLLMLAAMAATVMAVVLASPAHTAATITVTTAADEQNTNAQCSLRESMINANANNQSGSAACVAGTGDDTIVFDQSLSGKTITLTSTLPTITDSAGLTIDGGSANITVSGNSAVRVFQVGSPTISGAKLTLNNLTVANGKPTTNGGITTGGGILNQGTLTVSNSTFSNNSAGSGGGIYNGGTLTATLTVSNSTLSGNSASNGNGGGIYNDRTLTVSNSTLSGNSAGQGGGIYSDSGGNTLRVSNSTLSGNSVTGSFGGGGILSRNGEIATLTNTIVANSSPSGSNCTAANNGTITNGGYNLDSGTSCGFGTNNHSLSSTDPMLGPLAANGGPTKTHALLAGSPAIDKGNAFGESKDQRGQTRPSDFSAIPNAPDGGDGSDIGAFEVQAANQSALNYTGPTTGTFGDKLTLSSSGGSGTGAVTYDTGSSTACQLGTGADAGKLLITSGTGTCSVEVKKAGDNNYNAASSGPQTINVSKAQATLTLSGLTGNTYNGSPQGATVTTSPAGLGGVSVTYDGSATVPKDAGSYTVVASLNNPNYEATDATGPLVIDQKSLTVTADNQQSTFGDANLPANSVTYTNGFVNNEGPGVLGGTLSYDYYQNGNPVANPQNAGTYAIRPSGLTSDNYQITFADGTLTINRAVGSVSITNLPSAAVFGGSFTPNVSASGDGATSVTSLTSGTCTVSNAGVVNFVGVGTCTLKSSVAQGTNFEAATNQQGFQIAKAHATLTLSGLTGNTYNGSPQGVTVSTTPAVPSGQLTVTYDGSTTRPTNAGSYNVVASLNDANYEATDATGTFVIAKAQATLTLSGLSKTYNGSPQGATVTISPAGLSGVSATYDGNAQAPTNAGSYAVLASLDNPNYQAPNATGTLNIAKAALTVTAQSQNMKYADPVPTLTYQISGFVNSETLATSGVTGQPNLSTTATSSSAAGNYPITVALGTLTSSNYSFPSANYLNSTLTVAKRLANVLYTGDNYAAVASGNATINLSAKVSRLSGSLGDLSKARVQFTVTKYGGGNVQGTPVLASVDANGNAAATASVPTSVNPYIVEVRIDPDNTYWTSGTDVSSLQVIVLSGSARTAGGGWIADAANDINGKSNFGFTVQNSKTGIKGNSLFIYRAKEGANEVQYVVKSNSWVGGGLAFNINNDPAKATFTGKATVQRYVNGVLDTSFSSGNYTFTVDVLDGALKSPQVADGYAISLRDSSNTLVKQLGTRAAPVTLGGGNVLVQVK